MYKVYFLKTDDYNDNARRRDSGAAGGSKANI